MKHSFIINPAAGPCDRTVQIKNAVERVFTARGLDYEILVSQKPGGCMELAKKACQRGEEVRLYACGGDGTLNEVVNGAAGHDNVAVTHYPAGSGNDFIKIFDRPAEFKNLERLLDAEEAEFDLIECRDENGVRYAVNICSVGLAARIGTEISAYRRLPLVNGKGAYLMSTAVNVVKGIHRPYEIELCGKVIAGRQTLMCVCNGRYYGGSFNPVPDAEPDDGLLDVLVVKAVSRLKVAQVVGQYQKGRYADFPDLISHYRTDTVRIRGEESAAQLDGEAHVSADMTFSVAKCKLRFFYPSGLQYRSKVRADELVGAI